MRVLLINPSMNLDKLGRFAKLLEPMPCIGLAYIAGALERHQVDVKVVDMFAEGFSANQVLDRVREYQPDLGWDDCVDTLRTNLLQTVSNDSRDSSKGKDCMGCSSR